MASFTDADEKKLQELQAKKRKAKADERNERRRDDRTCQRLFGRDMETVKTALAEYDMLSNAVKKFCNTNRLRYEDFSRWVDSHIQREQQKQSQQTQKY